MSESKSNSVYECKERDHSEQSCDVISPHEPSPVDLSEFDDLMDTLEAKSERPLSKGEREEVTNLFSTVADSNAMKNLVRLFRQELAKTALRAHEKRGQAGGGEVRDGVMQKKEKPSFEEVQANKKKGMQKQLQSEATIRQKLLELDEFKKVQQCLKDGGGKKAGFHRALHALSELIVNNTIMMRELMVIELSIVSNDRGEPQYKCAHGSAEVKTLASAILNATDKEVKQYARDANLKPQELLASANIIMGACLMRESQHIRKAENHWKEAERIRPHLGQRILLALLPLTIMFEDSVEMREMKFETKEELGEALRKWNIKQFDTVIDGLTQMKNDLQSNANKLSGSERSACQWEINEIYALIGRLQGSATHHKKSAQILKLVVLAMDRLPKPQDKLWEELCVRYLHVISEVNDIFTDDKWIRNTEEIRKELDEKRDEIINAVQEANELHEKLNEIRPRDRFKYEYEMVQAQEMLHHLTQGAMVNMGEKSKLEQLEEMARMQAQQSMNQGSGN